MVRSGTGSRVAGVLLAAAVIGLAAAPAASAALSKPERKAVDITGIDGASTATVSFARVTFKGDLSNELGTGGLKKASVTFSLVPSSGPTTTITSRKASRRPADERTGTDGRFAAVRDGREIVLLVEELPAATTQLEVTTAGPVAEQRANVRRQGPVYDFLFQGLNQIGGGDSLDDQVNRARDEISRTEEARDKIEERIEEVERRLGNAEDAVNAADTAKEAEEAREAVKRLKAQLQGLRQDLKAKEDHIEATRGWVRSLNEGPAPPPVRQCSDMIDNDKDGTIDLSDPGCGSSDDNDEKDEPVPVTCPAPGQTRGGIAVINTPQTNSISAFSLRKAGTGQLVLEAPVQAESAPPATLPGEICGPGVNVTFEWRQYTDGDPFGFPDPPPGDRAFRIVIFADNPFGSGNPGGQDATLNLALGTAPQ